MRDASMTVNGCAGWHGGGKNGERAAGRSTDGDDDVVMVDVNARGERGQAAGLQHTRCTDL